jgi:hypothetical protein
VGSDAGDMDASGGDLDEEQHIQPPQPDRVDDEEVAGDDPGGLLAKERSPSCRSPPWRWIQSVAAQRGADRGRRDLHAKLLELAFDALVAPARILLGEADDELLDAVVERRSPLSMTRVGPGACNEAAVPAQQRLGLHEEARPAGPRQCPADRREQGTVGGLQPGTGDLTT